ncbi:hypothetical protein IFR05_017440, partial [Cadophora sp. M221]
MATLTTFTTVVIIGAGFSGLGTAYPGCGVDIPAVLYSLSFAPYSKFSRLFPDQSEILSYLEGLAADFDINKQITYNVSLTKAEWQEKKSTWLLTLQRGPNGEFIDHECKVLIFA